MKPAYVEPIEGSSLNRMILSERAAERSASPRRRWPNEQVGGEDRRGHPVLRGHLRRGRRNLGLHDQRAAVFVREAIGVERIDGDTAYLSEGPAAGTEVVTVGAAELFGAERYQALIAHVRSLAPTSQGPHHASVREPVPIVVTRRSTP